MTKSKNKGRVVKTTVGHDGRTIVHREVTVDCKRCAQPFTCVMTTRPPAACPGCRVIIDAEIAAREKARAAAKRADNKPPAKRLIPYAGYDPRERKSHE